MNNGLDAAPGFCKTCSLQDKKMRVSEKHWVN